MLIVPSLPSKGANAYSFLFSGISCFYNFTFYFLFLYIFLPCHDIIGRELKKNPPLINNFSVLEKWSVLSQHVKFWGFNTDNSYIFFWNDTDCHFDNKFS